MQDIAKGQRWVSHTEQNLGLGIIRDISGRLITIDFPAAEEQRTYARDNAPISRIIYSVGDQITTHDDEILTVKELLNDKGLVGYVAANGAGDELVVPEMNLSAHVLFTTPRQRLLSGQIDGNSAFRLRVKTLDLLNKINASQLTGLSAGRMELLPHQIYIAQEVAKRFAPRVLLADEVGLGKTIEAAMIIHYQLFTHQASRVLILVPESLQHQWFVELLRRFNMHFSLMNQDRLEDALSHLILDEDAANPFEMEQLVISSPETILSSPQYQLWLQESEWDLLAVDEAHHLEWSETSVSESYALVESLSCKIPAVLLLTATPEQVGTAGHFARLRLLDANRYSRLENFLTEENDYKSLNNALEYLEQHQGDDVEMAAVYQTLGNLIAPELFKKLQLVNAESIPQLIDQLLDLHGTGRVLFRNQRSHIEGFPTRHVETYELPAMALETTDSINATLYPETTMSEDEWFEKDPRIAWLSQFLRDHKREKVLLICHHDETALALDKYLNLKQGIRTTAFVPELSIIERDRAAAYFAETEGGAQALICSEIGSEGRNFQFAQHLVLFDLPLNPDLVEQRIGRLDRIGQGDNIYLHIPLISDSAQQRLFQWYHEGVNLFKQTASAGFAIFKHFEAQLTQELLSKSSGFAQLIEDTKTYRIELNHELQEGKDKLLERNSCDKTYAGSLISDITSSEQSDELTNYMLSVYDEYGLECESHSDRTFIIKPTEHMRESYFPGLKDEGQTVTFDRTTATSREDYDFLTWEHPMVSESMESIRDTEIGNAAVATIKVKGLKAGTVLLESSYSISTSAPKSLQLERYLGLNPLRLLVDVRGKNLSAVVSHDAMNQLTRRMPKDLARRACQQLRNEIDGMIQASSEIAQPHLSKSVQQAKSQLSEKLQTEISRLELLAKMNPSVRPEEISNLEQRLRESLAAIDRAELQVQGLRLIITQ